MFLTMSFEHPEVGLFRNVKLPPSQFRFGLLPATELELEDNPLKSTSNATFSIYRPT
jgi:hypothetical protein